jgi:hypothetical protein
MKWFDFIIGKHGKRTACLLLACGGIFAGAADAPRHVNVYERAGDFAGWPANGGLWSWGNELLVCYDLGAYKPRNGNHAFDPDVPMRCVFSRSLDGGETWALEEHANVPLPTAISDADYMPKPDSIDFTGDGFAMKFRDAAMWLSDNRGRNWIGPLRTSNQSDFVLLNRTNYIVTGGSSAMVFMTVREKLKEGQVRNRHRSWAWQTRTAGKTFGRVALLGDAEKFDDVSPDYDAYSIMPSALRLGDAHYICAVRELIRTEKWVRIYESKDSCQTWTALTDIAQGAHNPAALVSLADGRVVAIYGARQNGPMGIFARMSRDKGKTWEPEIALRQDAANWDFGYPVATVRPDGAVVAIYYMSTEAIPHQHIAATHWKPGYAAPELTGLEPAVIIPGGAVTITGKNLHYITSVRFAGAEAATFEANAEGTRITASAPEHFPGTGGEVSVVAAGGVAGGIMFTPATPPTGLRALRDHVVVPGHGLTLSASADGNPAPVYYWEVLKPAGGGWERVQEDNIHSVLGDGTLRIAAVDGAVAQWRYRFVADNGAGVPAVSPTTAGILLSAENPIPHPVALEIDRNDRLYIADDALSCVQQINKTGGASTLAGGALQNGAGNGQGVTARFDRPSGLTIAQNGLLIVADAGNSNLRSVTADGITHDFAGRAKSPGSGDGKNLEAGFDSPAGISSDDAGNIYVADAGNHAIRLITPEGMVKTMAGKAGEPGGAAGGSVTGGQARFRVPKGVLAHTSGTIYVADTGNHVIRAIAPGEPWNVSIVAGLGQTPGALDGSFDQARFDSPQGMAEDVLDRNIIYIADTGNSLVRKLDLARETVSTLAGRTVGAPFHGYQNGRAADAVFDHPSDVVMSLSGTLFVADTGNAMIRQIDGAGNVSTFSPPAASGRPDDNPGNEVPSKSPPGGGGGGVSTGIYFLLLMMLLCVRRHSTGT